MAFDFSLETGELQLTPFFEAVQLHRYRDSLSVTDAEALVEYVQSTVSMRLEEDELAAFRRILSEEISHHGAVHVAKCAGLFEARKG